MKIWSWNVRGLGGVDKWVAVKQIIRSQKLDVVFIQESKVNSEVNRVVKEIWGGNNVRWLTLSANSSAGGIFFYGTVVEWNRRIIGQEYSQSQSLRIEIIGRNASFPKCMAQM